MKQITTDYYILEIALVLMVLVWSIYSTCVICASVLNRIDAAVEEIVAETTCNCSQETIVEESVVVTPEASTPEVVVAEEPPVEYFDVPLDADLQDHIFAECEKHGIDPAIVIAMIDKESDYRASIKGDSGRSYGLMQIQLKWHKDRMERLGCDDLLDPYQNVSVGIDYLAEMLDRDKGVEWALMAYNGGASYANKKASNGEISDYASTILTMSEQFERVYI